ncbi:MAG: hypothetical protein M1818_006549 [Claussenomyces sp. TS43310]|nr:MAG: hypothetical protein M1818_006549 [Claussenomyces sp. TS43310]
MAEKRIARTSWPETPVPKGVKELAGYFLSLLDTNTDDAGVQLASRVFTPDAVFMTSSATFKGAEEIKESRTEAWRVVERRFHEIIKVFSAKDDASDLLMIGNAVLNLKNGKEVKGDFIAHMVLDKVATPDVRISYFQVWGDTGPMIRAMQDN